MENSNVRVMGMRRRNRNRMLFYIALIAFPLAQFIAFYVYVNANSIIMAFQEYSIQAGTKGWTITPAGFGNFRAVFDALKDRLYLIENSLINFVFNFGVGLTLAVIFSFYLYKKYPMSGLFKVILFIPKIVPGIVFTMLFEYIATDVYMFVAKELTGEVVKGLFDNPATEFPAVLFYTVWFSFGINVLLFNGAMCNINESIVESAHLDGANIIQEFWYITLPSIWGTFTTFVVITLSGIFTHQMSLFSFYGNGGMHIGTLGYYLYVGANVSSLIGKDGYLTYPQLSAMGLLSTAILAPITLFIKWAMRKFGPSVN